MNLTVHVPALPRTSGLAGGVSAGIDKDRGLVYRSPHGHRFFYDRLAKGRPVATISFKDEHDKVALIRLNNPSTYDVVVLRAVCAPQVFDLSSDREIRSILHAAAGSIPSFVLPAGETVELYLISRFRDGIPLEVAHQKGRFQIHWRRGNATWLWQMPVVVWSDTSMIRQFTVERRRYAPFVNTP